MGNNFSGFLFFLSFAPFLHLFQAKVYNFCVNGWNCENNDCFQTVFEHCHWLNKKIAPPQTHTESTLFLWKIMFYLILFFLLTIIVLTLFIKDLFGFYGFCNLAWDLGAQAASTAKRFLFFSYLLSKVQFSSMHLLAQHLLSSVHSLLYTSAFIWLCTTTMLYSSSSQTESERP